ncbi:MAG TPA: phenylalanine--tRNA ligase subunit beta [bacterium]
MLFSVKWLEDLLGAKINVEQLTRSLLDLGIETEGQSSLAPPGIVTGLIKGIDPHPKLHNLSILDIKTTKKVQIVTAAKNIKPQDIVLVGPVGVTFQNETIVPKDFDGVRSDGTLVSEEELGLAEKSTGVIVLDQIEPGREFKDCLDDVVIEIKTFPNRFDWLSMIGLAREVAIALGISYSPEENLAPQANHEGAFKILIKDLSGCPRYTARIFEDIAVQESPFWMKWRLHCMGMKGISNVVDITNIMMLMYGQPLHPFDLDLLKGSIIIRRARAGEEFITLEGTVFKLTREDLVIADKNGPIALAGVIGSKRAEISASTNRVLLESAYFDPARIAATARRLGIQTEASMRFERGADYAMVDETSLQTAALFKKYAAARETEFTGCGKKMRTRKVRFSAARLNKILSLDLPNETVKKMLARAHIHTTGSTTLAASIPHYRGDLRIEEDIFEEVARLYGYMKIPEVPSLKWVPLAVKPKSREYEETVKDFMVGRGFNETYNLSLAASKRLTELGYTRYVSIKNPLNERFDSLRPSLFSGMIDCVLHNRSKGNYNLQLFEIGNILIPEEPFQEKHLGVAMGGEARPGFWHEPDRAIDYFDAKGTTEALFAALHIQNIQFSHVQRTGFSQATLLSHANMEIGYLGVIDRDLCEGDYMYFELNLDKLWPLVSESFYQPPAKFPANIRDLSFLVDNATEASDMMALMRRVGGPVLEKTILFDYYKGKNLAEGKKSFGFRLYFRAPDRTLTDAEVEKFISKIVLEITGQFQASLRTKETHWRN